MLNQRVSVTLLVLLLMSTTARGQGPSVTSEQAAPFMGTWVFTMTDPPHFKGTQQVVKLSDENGRIVASLQVGKFPPSDVTGIYRDGDMLVLTIGLHAKRPIMENGAALRTVIALTREGDEMKMAQMFGEGPTVKRGIAKKQ